VATSNNNILIRNSSHKLHLAVLAALPLMAMASFNVSAACTVSASNDVVCTSTSADYSFDIEAVSNSPVDINGQTITVKNLATVNGANVTPQEGGVSQGVTGKIGIFVRNGEFEEATTTPADYRPWNASTSSLDGANGSLLGKNYVNEGTEINIEAGGVIDVTGDAVTTGFDYATSGIFMDGSNNTVNNEGRITVHGTANTVHWGVMFSGDDANNVNPTVNNDGNIEVLTSLNGSITQIHGAVVMKEAIINGIINNNAGGTIHVGYESGFTGTKTTKTLYGVYADDNARDITLNNYNVISVDNPTGCHSNGVSANASCNAAVYLRSFDARINNYADAVITGDVKARDTTHSFILENAGLIDGYVIRQVNKVANSQYNTIASSGLTAENSYTTYIPVIKIGGGNQGVTGNENLAEISGYISGNFGLVKYNDTAATSGTPNAINHTFTIRPKIDGATVHAGDEYTLTGGVLDLGGVDVTKKLTLTTVVDNTSPLVTWSAHAVNDEVLSITVDSINSASILAGVTQQSAGAIDALLSGDSTLGGAVQGLTVAADINKAGQQLSPEANNASLQATITAVVHVTAVIGNRQDGSRVASGGISGISTGEAAQGSGFWMQGFGFKGDQDKRGGIDGYSANTGGFVLGGDTLVGNGEFRVGAALGYASTGIQGEGVNVANRTDIDSYQGTVYGSWNAGAWYVDAALGYGRHQYDTKRFLALTNSTLTGNHDANQYLAKIGGGYPIQLGKATFTPLASVTYVQLDQDGYTEKDRTNSGAALTVDGVQNDSFRSGLGAKVSLPLSEGALKAAVEARAIWNHEFADTNQDIAARFAGGTSFTTNGISQARDSANLGLGVSLASANGQSLSVNYDAEVKSDYVGHTAAVKFRYDF
jgi:outer membrane autotransporter protein